MAATKVLASEEVPGEPEPGLQQMPGHIIRRLQQVSTAVFMQETEAFAVTSVQFAVLFTICRRPGMDQRTLSKAVTFDASTIGGVIDRLEVRGLLERRLSPQDRRVRLLYLTDAGKVLLDELLGSVSKAQDRMLEPLSAAQKAQFFKLAQLIIAHHDPAV